MADSQLLMGSKMSNGHATTSSTNGPIALPPYSSVRENRNDHSHHDSDDGDEDDEEEDNRILGSELRRSLLFDASDMFDSVPKANGDGVAGNKTSGNPRGGPPLRLNIASTPSPFSTLRNPPPETESPPRGLMDDLSANAVGDTMRAARKKSNKSRDGRRVRFDVDDAATDGDAKGVGTTGTGKVLDL